MQEIPIMFCFNKNYVLPASVAFYSLLESNIPSLLSPQDYFFKLFVVHNDISIQDQEKLKLTIKPFENFASLEFINAENYLQDTWNNIQNTHHFAYEVFYKLIVPSLFPQYDKMIVSDVDVVFLGSIVQEFVEFDSEENALISGVVSFNPKDFFPIPSNGWRSAYRKFNSQELEAISQGIDAGYLIFNLKRWREENIQQKAISYLQNNAHKLVLSEQDVLNIVCQNRIKKLNPAYTIEPDTWKIYGHSWEKLISLTYSTQELKAAREHPIQLHYHGANKPWIQPHRFKADIWFSTLCKTPFLQSYLDSLESKMFEIFKKRQLKFKIITLFKKDPFFIFNPNFYKILFDKLKKHQSNKGGGGKLQSLKIFKAESSIPHHRSLILTRL